MAEAFGAPLLYQAAEPGGSLRAAARREGMHILVYEAGEPLRFDAEAIRIGVEGALRVMGALGMTAIPDLPAAEPSFVADDMRWVRATRSGIFHATVGLGEVVRRHQELGFITTPFPGRRQAVKAPFEALVAGATANPLVHRGDALVHLARRGAAARGAR
jgi:predicted deacylase